MASERAGSGTGRRPGGVAVCAVMVALFALMIGEAVTLRPEARLAPLVVGIPAALLALAQLVIELRNWSTVGVPHDVAAAAARRRETRRALVLIAWFAGLIGITLLLGVLVAFPVFIFCYLVMQLRTRPAPAAVAAAGFAALVFLVFDRLLGLSLWPGFLSAMLV